jgi:hypothetical protein
MLHAWNATGPDRLCEYRLLPDFREHHSAFGVHKCGKPADSELIGRQDRPDGCYIAVGLPQDEPFFLADHL